MTQTGIIALRMERQYLSRKANEQEYLALYRDTQPGQNVYWNGFGDPPSITFRADFDDIEYNRQRQKSRALIKGRFAGGNLGWIMREELELFAALYRKPLAVRQPAQETLLELLEREGLMSIQGMKELTGMLVKEITPVLHRLQEAFLVYEDQYDGEWDRGWYPFSEMFPEADLEKYTRQEAIAEVLRRFAYRHVWFDTKMAKSFYKLPEKEIKAAAAQLATEGILVEAEGGYVLRSDLDMLQADKAPAPKGVYAMHRNDFLVRSNEHWLKERFAHPAYGTMQYLLIDGVFRGAVVGQFKYGPGILEDIITDLPEEEAQARKTEIFAAVHAVNFGADNPILRYHGELQNGR